MLTALRPNSIFQSIGSSKKSAGPMPNVNVEIFSKGCMTLLKFDRIYLNP